MSETPNDGGQAPVETPAETSAETPAEQPAVEGGEEATPELTKIGDKEYTPEELAELQKKGSNYDNLLPEFTRKSQELAELKDKPKPNTDSGKADETKAPYEDPNWKPETYAELTAAILDAKAQGMKEVLAVLEKKETDANKVKEDVDNFITDVRKTSKNFDEKEFFNFASRYKVPVNTLDDLKNILEMYNDFQKLSAGDVKKVGEDDKVHKGKTGDGGKGETFDDLRTGGGNLIDKVKQAYNRIK